MMKNIKYKLIAVSAFLLIGAASVGEVKAQNYQSVISYEEIMKNNNSKNQKVQDWKELITELKNSTALTEKEKVKLINRFWNTNLYSSSDLIVWGKSDYWATPVESLTKGAGDCEDFVLGKYLSLLAVGVSETKLKLSYVKVRVGGLTSDLYESHMVLEYKDKDNTFILDNMVKSLKDKSKRIDLVDVFSFNSSGIYVKGVYQSPAENIKLWADYKQRITPNTYVKNNLTAKLKH